MERRWENRDFLKMIVPRALLDPTIAKVLGDARVGRDLAILERLKRFRQFQQLREEEVETLAGLIDGLGFDFGFLRPVVFGLDRLRAKKMATMIASMLIRNL